MGNQVSVWQGKQSKGMVIVAAAERAARGFDDIGVTMVVHFDVPRGVKNYVHSAGRAGRAGRAGISITMVVDEAEVREMNEGILGPKIGANVTHLVSIDDGNITLQGLH